MNPEDRGRILVAPRLLPYLDELVGTGLYGGSIEDVNDTLVSMALRQLVAEGQMKVRRVNNRTA